MAEYDNKAFNAMNESVPDTDIGGAIDISEYEQNMDVSQRKGFEREVLNQFLSAYNINPLKKGRLPFKSFVKNLDPELVSSWAEDAGRENMEGRPLKHRSEVYYNAEKLMKLASLHTGRIEDLRDIADRMYDKRDGRDGADRFIYPGYWSKEDEAKDKERRYDQSLIRDRGYLIDPKTREIIHEG